MQLRGWRVGREHAKLIETRDGWTLEDRGQFTGTWVNLAHRALRAAHVCRPDPHRRRDAAGARGRGPEGQAARRAPCHCPLRRRSSRCTWRNRPPPTFRGPSSAPCCRTRTNPSRPRCWPCRPATPGASMCTTHCSKPSTCAAAT
ncbi:hypothetical protein [Roseateles sp.]|uniref:hypothetical protein n=1 Tax=Roseateles sp. TaxID=1971397 RepID=UPI00387ED654